MIKDTKEPKREHSEFSGQFTDAGVTVFVNISRPAGSHIDWTLQVTAEDNGVTAWEEGFATDRDAFDEFLATIERDGIRTFLDDVDPQVH